MGFEAPKNHKGHESCAMKTNMNVVNYVLFLYILTLSVFLDGCAPIGVPDVLQKTDKNIEVSAFKEQGTWEYDSGRFSLSSGNRVSFDWPKGEARVILNGIRDDSIECKVSILDYSSGLEFGNTGMFKFICFKLEDLPMGESDSDYFIEIVNALFLELVPRTLEKYDKLDSVYLEIAEDFIPSSLKNEFMNLFAIKINEETDSSPWNREDMHDYIAGPFKEKLQWFRCARAFLMVQSPWPYRTSIEFEDGLVYFDPKYSGMSWKELALLSNCGLLPGVLNFYFTYDNREYMKWP